MGAVTVGVSLPRQWVGERGLTAGSAIHLRTLPDGSLLLRDRIRSAPIGRVWIPVGPSTAAEHLFRQLIGAYLGGAAEFVLNQPEGIAESTRGIARLFARRTIQPEIVDEQATTLLLRDVSLGAGLALPELLHRMFERVMDLHTEAGRTWVAAGPAKGEPLNLRDDAVDRYGWLIERILALRNASDAGAPGWGGSVDDPLQTLLLTRSMERIADHAVSLGENGTRLFDTGLPPKIANALTGYHQQALEALRSAVEVAERPQVTLANEIIDAGEALHGAHAAISEAYLRRGSPSMLPPAAIAALGLALASIDRTVAYAQDIAQVGLDRACWAEIGRTTTVDPIVPLPRTIPLRPALAPRA